MKTLKWIGMLAGVALTSGCVYETGHTGPHHRPPPPAHGQGDSRYYQEGYSRGTEDARRGYRREASRHWGGVPRQFRNEFSRGYERGYDSVDRRPGSGGRQENHFSSGRNAGAQDARRGLSYQPSRHWNTVSSRYREEFSRGYAEGYRARPGRR